jgi:hypothetical protein
MPVDRYPGWGQETVIAYPNYIIDSVGLAAHA